MPLNIQNAENVGLINDFWHEGRIEFGRDFKFCTITNYLYIFGEPAGLCLYY